jgi:large subunit ribosomal protein L17
MRHLVKGRKLNRTTSHRKAMLSNLAMSILDKERVETTLPKAKEVRRVVERLITYAKKGDLHGRRLAARRINNKEILKKLFSEIAPVYKDRNGGYVRILKTRNRKGDNTLMAIVELVGIGGADTVRKRRKKKKEEQGGPGAPKAAVAQGKEEKATEGSK